MRKTVIRISVRDLDQDTFNAKQEGKMAVKNQKKNPFIRNPYLEGTEVALAWAEGVKEQKELGHENK